MSASPDLPDLVARAFAVTRQAGYVSFCRNETGRLLAALAATRQGVMAEFGTGTGVGAAWLRSGLTAHGARIVTAEIDERLATAAAAIFADDDRVEVVSAGWDQVTSIAPFSLLFIDQSLEGVAVDSVAELVEPGGIVVIDDFTPSETWPPTVYGQVDRLREDWLTDPRFIAAEVMVAPDAAVVIATKR